MITIVNFRPKVCFILMLRTTNFNKCVVTKLKVHTVFYNTEQPFIHVFIVSMKTTGAISLKIWNHEKIWTCTFIQKPDVSSNKITAFAFWEVYKKILNLLKKKDLCNIFLACTIISSITFKAIQNYIILSHKHLLCGSVYNCVLMQIQLTALCSKQLFQVYISNQTALPLQGWDEIVSRQCMVFKRQTDC